VTGPEPPGMTWYFNTAGASEQDGYRWFAGKAGHAPSQAELLLMAPIAGSNLVKLTSEISPSIVLAKIPDWGYVFYATRLASPGAPAEGDHMKRRISVSVLGIAAADADACVLVDAAVAALQGDLAGRLPLSWTAGSPAIDQQPARWPLSKRDIVPLPRSGSDQESIGLPPARRSAAATALAALSSDDLGAFTPDRILLLDSDVVNLADLDRLRPWRVISPLVKEQVTFPRGSKSLDNRQLAFVFWLVLGLIEIGVLAGVLVWFFS
jgi:hypothetical protein